MAIKVIVELTAKPGRRDALRSLLEEMIAADGASSDGFRAVRATRWLMILMSWSRLPTGTQRKHAIGT